MARVTALLFLLFTLSGAALASDSTRTEQVQLSLLPERAAATPGTTLWLGLRFELIPHWHVYWRNPGDSGEAPLADGAMLDGILVVTESGSGGTLTRGFTISAAPRETASVAADEARITLLVAFGQCQTAQGEGLEEDISLFRHGASLSRCSNLITAYESGAMVLFIGRPRLYQEQT